MGTNVPHSFPHSSTATPDDPYEVKRARELNQLLGPKGTGQAFDFILDLHNTTANTGVCLISEASHSSFNLHLCHYLQVVPREQEEGWGGGRGTSGTSVLQGLPPEVGQGGPVLPAHCSSQPASVPQFPLSRRPGSLSPHSCRTLGCPAASYSMNHLGWRPIAWNLCPRMESVS